MTPASRSTIPFIGRDVFDAETCRRIRAAMDAGSVERAEVLGAGIELEESVRRTLSIDVDESTLAMVERRLDAEREALAAAAGVALSSREGTGFLRYLPGGFYKPHRDRGEVAGWPDAARRRIAVIVFLNTARRDNAPGDFSGGTLRLHPEGAPAVDIHPRAGLLVAFSADVLHEVTVVTDGTRDVIVDWMI